VLGDDFRFLQRAGGATAVSGDAANNNKKMQDDGRR
jgi:hypothetical protein